MIFALTRTATRQMWFPVNAERQANSLDNSKLETKSKPITPEGKVDHEDFDDHPIPSNQMAQKIPSLLDIPCQSGNLLMCFKCNAFSLTMLFAFTGTGRKRVLCADEDERPANRLDFSKVESKSPRIEFKKLWDSK